LFQRRVLNGDQSSFSTDSYIHVYEWNGDSWNQRGSDFDGKDALENYDYNRNSTMVAATLSGYGNIVAAGVIAQNDWSDAFVVIVYQRSGSSGKQICMEIEGKNSPSYSSYSVSSNYDGTVIATVEGA